MTAAGSTPPVWDIVLAARVVLEAASAAASQEPEPALTEARLADHYRDEGIPPLWPGQLRTVTAKLTPADWQRLAVIVALLGEPALRQVLPALLHVRPVRDQVQGLADVATVLATLELRALAASPVRAEELARRVARELRVAIAGETPQESSARLARIDYTRLLANVDSARADAEAQSVELQRRQRELDFRREQRRRGI